MKRRPYLLPLKILFSAGLLAYALSLTSISKVWDTLGHCHPIVYSTAIALFLLGQVLCAIKWRGLASTLGFNRNLGEFIYLYFVGSFFNLLLPTSIGGDAVRSIRLANGRGKIEAAAISVLADRGTGLAAMCMIAGIGTVLMPSDCIACVFKQVAFAALILTVSAIILPYRLKHRLNKTNLPLTKALVYWQPQGGLTAALIFSAVFQIIVIASHVLLGISMGIHIPWWSYTIIAPAAALASMWPISINGLGVREAAYVYLLSEFGVGRDIAVAFAVCWLGILLSSGLMGGLLLLIRPQQTLCVGNTPEDGPSKSS